jgi:hypothetical protein
MGSSVLPGGLWAAAGARVPFTQLQGGEMSRRWLCWLLGHRFVELPARGSGDHKGGRYVQCRRCQEQREVMRDPGMFGAGN